ncbi:MAG: flagellar basal body L-ring protein FlgH, partial [Deltaproteobacteria bacterium]|nr:flagellar basal body L-ring protein FlgH [Deltaproteobacteria bacterium]
PSPVVQHTARRAIHTDRAAYEGSLWMGSASWGNLLRDHRARYRGDLLTINELAKIIKVPEPSKDPSKEAAPPEGGEKAKKDPLLIFLEEQRKQREKVDQEQNDILRAIESVEVEVVRVLPNGNMVVRGIHSPIYRDRNRVKYLISLQGIVRPSDVDDKNMLSAPKLSKAEYKIRRLVRQTRPPLGSLARAAGKTQEGNTLDRLSDFMTAPGTGNQNTNVSK